MNPALLTATRTRHVVRGGYLLLPQEVKYLYRRAPRLSWSLSARLTSTTKPRPAMPDGPRQLGLYQGPGTTLYVPGDTETLERKYVPPGKVILTMPEVHRAPRRPSWGLSVAVNLSQPVPWESGHSTFEERTPVAIDNIVLCPTPRRTS